MVNYPLLSLLGFPLLLSACSPQPGQGQGELAGNGMANAVVNVIDDAQNAVDEVVNHTAETPDNVMSMPMSPSWGRNADIFLHSDIALEALADVDTLRGEGEMGCTFYTDGEGGAILAAKAPLNPVAFAVGVIANDGSRARLVSANAGGFAAIASGMRFQGQGVSALVRLKSRLSLTPVGKDSSYPANLEVTVGKERKRIYSGRWVCGL